MTTTEPAAQPEAKASDELIRAALSEVYDPEIGIDIVSLGLIYGTNIDDDGLLTIDMTLTTPYCPIGPDHRDAGTRGLRAAAGGARRAHQPRVDAAVGSAHDGVGRGPARARHLLTSTPDARSGIVGAMERVFTHRGGHGAAAAAHRAAHRAADRAPDGDRARWRAATHTVSSNGSAAAAVTASGPDARGRTPQRRGRGSRGDPARPGDRPRGLRRRFARASRSISAGGSARSASRIFHPRDTGFMGRQPL